MGSCTIMVSQKNVTVTKSHAKRVLIGFLCSVSKIQNTGHSQRIAPWEVI
ncbi:hypothetical protein BHE74_00008246 [Ensete ventricosum]|nr:hypothetical protein BHE74_00008246 [Ensete ventricosum]RZR86302.1 hypothetical protein BHM03_00013481 [Ensete ventricosum]